jgi:hypothetical protein
LSWREPAAALRKRTGFPTEHPVGAPKPQVVASGEKLQWSRGGRAESAATSAQPSRRGEAFCALPRLADGIAKSDEKGRVPPGALLRERGPRGCEALGFDPGDLTVGALDESVQVDSSQPRVVAEGCLQRLPERALGTHPRLQNLEFD